MKRKTDPIEMLFVVLLGFLLGMLLRTVTAAHLDQPLSYSGTLSSADHEQEEGIFNLVSPDAKPVLTIIIPSSWQRNEMRPFLGKKVTLTISDGTLQVLTRDHPQ